MIIRYAQGEVKTRDVIPTGPLVGEGWWSRVVEHKRDPDRFVVKKSFWFLEKEYEIGRSLHHANIAAVHSLYIKEISFVRGVYKLWMDPKWRRVVIDRLRAPRYSFWSLMMDRIHGKPLAIYKMVMERVHGKTLTHFYGKHLPDATVAALLSQAQNFCLYLFDRNIKAGDLHGDNIMLVDKTHQLKIVDFGHWDVEGNPEIRGWQLFKTAHRLMFNIISTSVLSNQAEGSNSSNHVIAGFCPFDASHSEIIESLVESSLTPHDFANKSESEIRSVLENYCQSVLAKFQSEMLDP